MSGWSVSNTPETARCALCGLKIYSSQDGRTLFHNASYNEICDAVRNTNVPPIHAPRPDLFR